MTFLKSEAAVNVLQFALSCGELLYPFMTFLKSEAAVNVLQFALSCGE